MATDADARPRTADQTLLKLARERFKQGQEASQHQRERVRADLRMYAGEQWTKEQADARGAQQGGNGLPAIPARPTESFNQLREPVRNVLNSERNADFGLELAPADDVGDLENAPAETEIELREGLIRRIQRDSEAQDARSWAFSRSTIAGEGYYAVRTRYVPGKSFDQECYVQRIANQFSVTLDPSHEQPDGSDAEWAFISVDLPYDKYQAEFGTVEGRTNGLANLNDEDFRAFAHDYPEWAKVDGETRVLHVAEYWYTERETRTLARLPDGSDVWEDEIPDGVTPVRTRPEPKKTIKWCKIDGRQILDQTDWPGPDLPIIKVVGEELHPYDQERRIEGMVRPARGNQVGFNVMVNKWIEAMGLTPPVAPPVVTPDQVMGFEGWYQLALSHAVPYLPYNLVSDAGQPLNPPTRLASQTPIQELAASVNLFREGIQSTTGVHDPQLGRVDPSLRSGKAIRLLQEQSMHGTSSYLDNLQRSMRYEGQVLNNLLYPVYGVRPGRLVRILTGEGEANTVQIGQPPTQTSGLMLPSMQQQTPTNGNKVYTLTPDANFNVIVKVTKAYSSRREEITATIGSLIEANPIFMSWFGDLFFRNSDWPGHLELADRAKAMLDPKIQAILQAKQSGQNVPPEVQAQLAQLQGQLQQAHQLLQQASQELQGKQAEAQTKVQIASMETDRALRLEQMRNATAIAVARINAAKGALDAVREDTEEAIALAQTQAHDAEQAMHDRAHESALSAQEHAQTMAEQQAAQQHQAAMGAAQSASDSEQADLQRQHEVSMQPPAPDGENEAT